MFYTLASKLLIKKGTTSRDYFYVFLMGSIGYIIVHWYLHMDKQDGIMEKIKDYLYGLMLADIVTAGILIKLYPAAEGDSEEDSNTSSNKEQSELTPEQKKLIMQRAQEARKLQQAHAQTQAQAQAKADASQTSPLSPLSPSSPSSPITQSPKEKSIFKSEDAPEQNESKTNNKSAESAKSNKSKSDKSHESEAGAKTKTLVKKKKVEEDVKDTEIPIYESKKQ